MSLCFTLSTATKSKTPFPYILEEEHHFVAGRVNNDAHRGSRVKAIPEKSQSESQHESQSTEGEGHFLRVIKKLAKSQKPSKTPVRFDVSGMTRMPTHSRFTSQSRFSKGKSHFYVQNLCLTFFLLKTKDAIMCW